MRLHRVNADQAGEIAGGWAYQITDAGNTAPDASGDRRRDRGVTEVDPGAFKLRLCGLYSGIALEFLCLEVIHL